MKNFTHKKRITYDPQTQPLQDPHDQPSLNKNNQIKNFSKQQCIEITEIKTKLFRIFLNSKPITQTILQRSLTSENNPKLMRINYNVKFMVQIMKSQKYP